MSALSPESFSTSSDTTPPERTPSDMVPVSITNEAEVVPQVDATLSATSTPFPEDSLEESNKEVSEDEGIGSENFNGGASSSNENSPETLTDTANTEAEGGTETDINEAASDEVIVTEPHPDVTATETPDQPSAQLWEEGENRVTLLLRAIFTLLAGWFLAWSQQNSTINSHFEWNRWISLSVISNLLIPLFIIWMFFGQGLWHIEWLSDQKYNAWNYGWKWRPFKRLALMSLGLWALMLPILWFASRDPNTQTFYRNYFPVVYDAKTWLWLIATVTIYMLCWEWFFRGFLLFGMAQGFGPYVAIILQAILFGLMHASKPGPEMWSSFAGGLILGVIAWREKSFVPAFLIHALIHVVWAVLMLR